MNQHLELISKRNIADYVTLLGAIPFILSLYLIVKMEPALALIASSIGFLIDSTDGVISRKLKQESDFGRQLDSSFDLLVYIVFPALFIAVFLNPWTPITIVTASVLIVFGALRLLRFNKIGFVYKRGIRCYPGLGTAYILPAVAILFLAQHFLGAAINWFTQFVLMGMSFAMISNIPIRKPRLIFWYPTALIIVTFLTLIYCKWI